MTTKLGRYEILEEIGQGGFANVYRALDVELEREVALKELKPALLGNLEWVKRFRREARTIARLDHPHIVPVYDVYETQQRLFIVMRLVNGPSLEQVLAEKGRLSWAEALEITTAVAAGLDYAHLQGILHRDLKPGNILLDPERGAMLTDFGMAKLVDDATSSVTAAGSVVGTPHYIAPEIWEGQGTTRQSDVYALGCILYEMLTGERLFDGDTPPAVMMAHFKPATLPQNWPPDVPSGVLEILKKALVRHPADRYVMAGEMAQALAAIGSVTPNGSNHQPESAWSSSQEPEPLPDGVRVEPVDFQEETRPSMKVATVGETESRASGKWEGFLGHLGSYVIVIGFLAVINFITDPGGYPWFIWPALGWGVGLAFHVLGIVLSELKNLSGKWRAFLRHFGSYAIIMMLLMSIYFITDPGGYPWFIWPGLGWGTAVAIHLWATMLGEGRSREQRQTRREDRRQQRTARRAARREDHQMAAPSRSMPASPRPAGLSNTAIQAHLDKAYTYKRQIDNLLRTSNSPNTQRRLQDLADHVRAWTQAIEALARRVDDFQQNTVIQQDLSGVPESIAKLEQRLRTETDEATRTELERTLRNRQNQLSTLQHLQKTMRRAEIKIESTLSALGTLYSQMLISQSTNHVADYKHLEDQVDEEVRTLQDHLEALEEVRLQQF